MSERRLPNYGKRLQAACDSLALPEGFEVIVLTTYTGQRDPDAYVSHKDGDAAASVRVITNARKRYFLDHPVELLREARDTFLRESRDGRYTEAWCKTAEASAALLTQWLFEYDTAEAEAGHVAS